jgi:hypothetical protein
MGQHAEAVVAISRPVEGFAVALGEEHPYTLAAKMSAGVLLADAGDLAAAERLEERVAEAMGRVLSPSHPDLLRCRANLLLTRIQRGDRHSIAQRRAVIEQLALQLGQDHPTVVTLREERRVMRSIDPQPF